MIEPLYFKTRDEFRNWLSKNCTTSMGIWLVFRKTKEIGTLKADEALEEALCFGWIDGVMKRIDDKSYMKYFSIRRKNSKWSKKNKSLAISLEKRGLMTDFGYAKIKEAKENGQWDNASKPSAITDTQIEELIELLKNTSEEAETVKVEEKTIATEVEDVEDKEDFISGNRCIQSYWRK